MILAVVSVEAFEQLTANAIFRGAAYGLLGAGFAIILGVTGRFHFAYSLTYTLGAYMAFTFWDRATFPSGRPACSVSCSPCSSAWP